MGLEILLIVVIAIAGMIVQGRLQKVFDKYSRVMFHGGLTGREVAEKMLRDHGIRDVRVTNVSGHLTDHYNPANKTLNLSDSVYNSNSVAAAAVAAVIILGLIMMTAFPALYWIGIAMFFMIFLFSAITLPVEYNASARALAWLERSNTLSTVELDQARTTLRWAARTYLVAALSALASLVYYLGFRREE